MRVRSGKHIAKQIGAKFCPLLYGIVDPKQYSNGQFLIF